MPVHRSFGFQQLFQGSCSTCLAPICTACICLYGCRPPDAGEAVQPPSSSAANGSKAEGRSAPRERSRSRDRGNGRPDDSDGEGRDGDRDEGGARGGSGRAGRDYVAERHAELDGMRAEARNKSYGRVKTSEEVSPCGWHPKAALRKASDTEGIEV